MNYIRTFFNTHVKCWAFYLLPVLLFPILFVLSQVAPTFVGYEDGNVLITCLVFGFLCQLFIIPVNYLAMRHFTANKLILIFSTLLLQLIPMAIFSYVMSFLMNLDMKIIIGIFIVFGIIAYFPNPLRAQFISKFNFGN